MRPGLPVAVAAFALAATGCGTSLTKGGGDERLGAARVERFLQKEFAGVDVTGSRCTKAKEQHGARRLTCAVDVMGTEVELHVDESGGGRYVRTEAVLDTAKVELFVVQQYDEQVGVTVTAECSAEKVIVVKPGTVIECTVVDSAGTTQTPKVTVQDVAGDVTVELA